MHEMNIEIFAMRLSSDCHARLFASKMLSAREVQRLVAQLQKDINDGVYDDVPALSEDN